jgi:hypothetical protein
VPAGRVSVLAIVATALALLVPSAAQARAPELLSVGTAFGHVTAEWYLPAGVDAIVLELSSSPETGFNGYFRSLITIGTLDRPQTALTPDNCDTCDVTKGKTYYVHVAGEDKTYRACGAREWSDTMKLTVSSDGQSVVTEDVGGGSAPCPKSYRGGGGGRGGDGGTGANVAPFFRVFSARRVQDVDKLFVRAVMSEKAKLTANATVSVRAGAARAYRFKAAKRTVGAGVRTTLRLKLAKRSLRAVKRALRKGKKLTAKIVVRARDSDGNTRIQRKKVRLKP